MTELVRYRYLCFFLSTFLMFLDACSRYIGPLAMIGGMVKKNCSDMEDRGELCWSNKMQASFIGAYFYGYALQMVTVHVAAKVGFNTSIRAATLVSGVIQLTGPLTARYSGVLAAVLQGVKGLAAGLFMAGNYECARKWSQGEEGKVLISLGGTMLYAGFGAGPFTVGLLTEHVGWEYPFYISGGVFLLLLLMQCIFMPDEPSGAWFMSESEKLMFRKKKEEETRAKSDDIAAQYKVSMVCILQRCYLYCVCIYLVSFLFVTYPEQVVIPFYYNEVLAADTVFLSYMQLGLSLTTVVASVCWKLLLPVFDKRISWLKCRMGLMSIPQIIRSANLALVPFTDDIRVSVALLVVNNLLVGSLYAGGIMTLIYELDPYNGPVVVGLCNGVGQAAGILLPLIRAEVVREGEWGENEVRWRWFFVSCGVMGLLGVISVAVGVVGRRTEWRVHPSLVEQISPGLTTRQNSGEGGRNRQCSSSMTVLYEAVSTADS